MQALQASKATGGKGQAAAPSRVKQPAMSVRGSDARVPGSSGAMRVQGN
jgi:hypothetical protein